MAKQKKIDIREFVERGYLQEVNRQFFHILGLSLDVKKSGNKYELSGIYDFRDVKGGIRFNPDTINTQGFINKTNNIKALQKQASSVRKEAYGSIMQPVPKEVEVK